MTEVRFFNGSSFSGRRAVSSERKMELVVVLLLAASLLAAPINEYAAGGLFASAIAGHIIIKAAQRV